MPMRIRRFAPAPRSAERSTSASTPARSRSWLRRSPRRRRPPATGRGCRRRPRAAATRGRSSTGTGRGCGPTSRPRTTGWPRRRATPGSRCWSCPGSAPTPSRRSSSADTRTRAGWRRRDIRCTAARPSSTSARRPRMAGSPPTRIGSGSCGGTAGRHGISALPARRRPARRRATRSGTETDGRRRTAPPSRASSRPATETHLLRSAARWNVSAGVLAAQLMAESGFNPRRGLSGRCARDRPVHAGRPPALRPARSLRPGRRDRRPGAPDVRPAAAVPLDPPGARRLQRRRPVRWRPATAPLPTPRPRPTWPGSSPCSTARGCCSRRRWRSGS